jgi:hypothetical protein
MPGLGREAFEHFAHQFLEVADLALEPLASRTSSAPRSGAVGLQVLLAERELHVALGRLDLELLALLLQADHVLDLALLAVVLLGLAVLLDLEGSSASS